MSEPELHRQDAPSMFLTPAEAGGKDASAAGMVRGKRAGRPWPEANPATPLNEWWLPVAAFFLAMAVGWLVFSGTAARLLEPGVTEFRELRKISAETPATFDPCDPAADTECVAESDRVVRLHP
jgi:hypothetical protein